jgi:hypothetical protein
MKRLFRSLLALTASGVMLLGPQSNGAPANAAPGLAQPRTPCDQLAARLTEVWDREAQIRADLAMAGDSYDLTSALDRFETVLADTDALLQRMDECSRSPVPSLAD